MEVGSPVGSHWEREAHLLALDGKKKSKEMGLSVQRPYGLADSSSSTGLLSALHTELGEEKRSSQGYKKPLKFTNSCRKQRSGAEGERKLSLSPEPSKPTSPTNGLSSAGHLYPPKPAYSHGPQCPLWGQFPDTGHHGGHLTTKSVDGER